MDTTRLPQPAMPVPSPRQPATLWKLWKNGCEIECVFESSPSVSELRLVRDGVRCATHRFDSDGDALEYADALERDLTARGWVQD